MKKFFKIMKEYPPAAALCTVSDIIVTCRYTSAAITKDSMPIVYAIALYGAFMASLIIAAGWVYAKIIFTRKETERRKMIRMRRLSHIKSKDFYEIAKNLQP